jgi:hypothetical protein
MTDLHALAAKSLTIASAAMLILSLEAGARTHKPRTPHVPKPHTVRIPHVSGR